MKKIRIDEIKRKLENHINQLEDSNCIRMFEITGTGNSYKPNDENYKEFHITFLNATIYMILKSLAIQMKKENNCKKIIEKELEKIIEDNLTIEPFLKNNWKKMIQYEGNVITDKEKRKLFEKAAFNSNKIKNYSNNKQSFIIIKYSKLQLHRNLERFLDKIAIGIETYITNNEIKIHFHRIGEKHK